MELKTPLFKKPYIELDNEQEKELFKLDKDKEIKRLKEEYMMLQNASDEVEEELQQRIDKALSYLRDIGNWLRDDSSYRAKLIDILQGSDKEC